MRHAQMAGYIPEFMKLREKSSEVLAPQRISDFAHFIKRVKSKKRKAVVVQGF